MSYSIKRIKARVPLRPEPLAELGKRQFRFLETIVSDSALSQSRGGTRLTKNSVLQGSISKPRILVVKAAPSEAPRLRLPSMPVWKSPQTEQSVAVLSQNPRLRVDIKSQELNTHKQ